MAAPAVDMTSTAAQVEVKNLFIIFSLIFIRPKNRTPAPRKRCEIVCFQLQLREAIGVQIAAVAEKSRGSSGSETSVVFETFAARGPLTSAESLMRRRETANVGANCDVPAGGRVFALQ
jgi:hypothetical protein